MRLIHYSFDRRNNANAQRRYYLRVMLLFSCLFNLNQASSSQYYKNNKGNNNSRKITRKRSYHYTGSSSVAASDNDDIEFSSFDSYCHHSSDYLTSSSSSPSSSSSSLNIGGRGKIPRNPIALPNYENAALFEDRQSQEDDYEEDRILQALARMEECKDADHMRQQQRRRQQQSNITSRRRSTKNRPRKKRIKKSTSNTISRKNETTENVSPPILDKKKKKTTKKDKMPKQNVGKFSTGTRTSTKSGSSPANHRSPATKSKHEISATQCTQEKPASIHRPSTTAASTPPSVNATTTSTSSPVPKTTIFSSIQPLSSRTSSSAQPPTQTSSQQQQQYERQEQASGIFTTTPNSSRASPATNIRREEMTPTKSTTSASPTTISMLPKTISTSTSTTASSPPPARTAASNIPQRASAATATATATAATATTTTTATVSSTTATNTNTTPWIRKFLSTRTKDVLFPIPKEYLSDGFNLAQLAPIVERIGFQAMGENGVNIANQLSQLNKQQQRSTSYTIYRLALQCILDEDNDDGIPPHHPLIGPDIIQKAAEALYLLVHARFAASPRGLEALRRVLLTSSSSSSLSSLNNNGVFGRCPRPSCQGCLLLPYGSSNNYSNNQHKCQRYCPCCGEAWMHWESRTDGCAWGPSLAHLLLLAHGNELYNINDSNVNNRIIVGTKTSEEEQKQTLPLTRNSSSSKEWNDNYHQTTVVPRVMGFRIHPATIWGKPLMKR